MIVARNNANGLPRRRLLLICLTAVGALLLGACQPAAAPPATQAATAAAVAPTVAATVAPTVAAAATVASTVAPTVVPPLATVAGQATAVAGSGTAGALAAQGTTVFASSCASCHGATGQGGAGPAVLPPGAHLGNSLGGRIKTAADLNTFVRQNMPLRAGGSLSSSQYDQVIAFILVGNNALKATDPFDPSTFGSINLQP